VGNNTGSGGQPKSARCAFWCSACNCRHLR